MTKKQGDTTTIDKIDAAISSEVTEKLKKLQQYSDATDASRKTLASLLSKYNMSKALFEMSLILDAWDSYYDGRGEEMSWWQVYLREEDVMADDGEGNELEVKYTDYTEDVESCKGNDNFMEYIGFIDDSNEECEIGGLIISDDIVVIHKDDLVETLREHVADEQPFCTSFLTMVYDNMSKEEKAEYTKLCKGYKSVSRVHG